jgi:small subunit ribosomal protein S13
MNIGKQYILPNKTVRFGLRDLYGIGPYQSNQICDHLGFSLNYKIKNLLFSEIESLIRMLEKFYIFGAKLKQEQEFNFSELIRIRSTRGFRRKQGLPCRGQRTKTNARTARKFKNKK